MDRTDANHISSGRDTRYKTAVVFLKVLQKGERVTLFSYSDDLKTRFYIAEHSEQLPAELTYREYYTSDVADNINDRGRSVSENTYMNQLFALAQKYNVLTNSLQWDIEHLSYSKPNLLKIISQINGISKSEYENKYNDGTKLNLIAGAALNVTATNPSGAYLAAGGKAYTSYLPAVSFGMNVFANPNTGKLVFRLELSLAENQYKSAYINKNSPYIPINYTYNQLAIGFAPQVIYNFYNTENFKIYGGLGLALTFYNYSNENFESQDGKTPGSAILRNNPFDFSAYNTQILIKLGVQFNKNLGGFINYLPPSSITHDDYFILSFSTMQIGVNYFFK